MPPPHRRPHSAAMQRTTGTTADVLHLGAALARRRFIDLEDAANSTTSRKMLSWQDWPSSSASQAEEPPAAELAADFDDDVVDERLPPPARSF